LLMKRGQTLRGNIFKPVAFTPDYLVYSTKDG
jgi:hypothetical protein